MAKYALGGLMAALLSWWLSGHTLHGMELWDWRLWFILMVTGATTMFLTVEVWVLVATAIRLRRQTIRGWGGRV